MARYTKTGKVASVPAINAELESIQEAIEDTLSRKGDSPNQMETDLDMNGNALLNVGTDPNNPESLVSRSDVYIKGEVDAKDTNVLQEAKNYADSVASGGGGVDVLSVGSNVSLLTNDAGYITSIELGALEARVGSNEGNIDANDLSISALTQDVNTLENEMDVVQQRSLNNLASVSSLSNGKADKVSSPVTGNFVQQNSNGNIVDAGVSVGSFATSTQGSKADSALQPSDNISELTNDSGFISGITAESITNLSDVDTTGKSIGRILEFDASGNLVVGDKSGGATSSFVGLSDTPSTYAGQAGKLVTVNSAENGVEFVDVQGAGLVDSVFGRVGAVTAQTGDYNSDQITNNSSISGASVSDALEAVEAAIPNISGKMDKLSSPTLDAVVTQDAFGNSKNSGVLLSSLATSQSVGSVDDRVDGVESDVTALASRVTVNEGDITALEGRATDLEAFEAQAGTSYGRDVITSSTDNTDGRVVVASTGQGYFGIGGRDVPNWTNGTDLNNITNIATGIYGGFLPSVSTADGWPENATSINYTIAVYFEAQGSIPRVTQQLTLIRDAGFLVQRTFIRTLYNTTWQPWAELWHSENLSKSEFATAAQGTLADTAIQPADLSDVATSGDYNDLINTPSIDFSNIRKSLLDSPLCRLFTPNKLVDTLAGPLTWTRATTATYVDRYGVVRTAAIDEPREEAEGWLIEGASTNLLTYSEQFDNADWNKSNLTVTPNATTAPDGTTTASKIVGDTISGVRIDLGQNASVTSGTTYTISAFLKEAEYRYATLFFGTSAFDFEAVGTVIDLRNATANNSNVSVKNIGKGWIRAQVTATATETGTFRVISINPRETDSGSVNDNSGDGTSGIFVWGAQLETLPFASSYIPTTTAAATRSRDIVSAEGLNNSPAITQDFSITSAFKQLGFLSFNTLYSIKATGSNDNINTFLSGAGNVFSAISPDNNLFSQPSNIYNKSISFSLTSGNGAYSQYVDGAGDDNNPITSTATNNALPEIIRFGIGANNSSGQAYGHIQDFRIYDFALNADEVAFLAGVK